MHGIILFELGRFAGERVGAPAWDEILRRMGLQSTALPPLRVVPDESVMRLVSALADVDGTTTPELLHDFGRWLAPHLLATYASLIPSTWTTLDILDNIESVIHRAVRMRDPQATPPRLETRRNADGSRSVIYSSERRLCHMATGLIHGIALSHGSVATVAQPSCMHAGAAHCELVVRLDRGQAPELAPLP